MPAVCIPPDKTVYLLTKPLQPLKILRSKDIFISLDRYKYPVVILYTMASIVQGIMSSALDSLPCM